MTLGMAEKKINEISANTRVRLGAVLMVFLFLASNLGGVIYLVKRDVEEKANTAYQFKLMNQRLDSGIERDEKLEASMEGLKTSIISVEEKLKETHSTDWERPQFGRWVSDAEKALKASLPDPWIDKYEPKN